MAQKIVNRYESSTEVIGSGMKSYLLRQTKSVFLDLKHFFISLIPDVTFNALRNQGFKHYSFKLYLTYFNFRNTEYDIKY